MFTDVKSPLKSLGVLGGAGGIFVGLGSLVGISLSADDVVQARDLVFSAASTIAGAIALWGRIRANSRIAFED